MGLRELVTYVSRSSVSKLVSLYDLAAKYDWDEYEVMRFLRCQQPPSPKMMRVIARELGISFDYMQEILERG